MSETGRKEKASNHTTHTGLGCSRNNVGLIDERNNRPGNQVPVVSEGYRYNGLKVNSRPLAIPVWAKTFIIVELVRNTDQGPYSIRKLFRKIACVVSLCYRRAQLTRQKNGCVADRLVHGPSIIDKVSLEFSISCMVALSEA
jgi:hypothetical protein